MIKKKLLLIFIGFFALVVGLTALEKAYGCWIMTNHSVGSHNVTCPRDHCIFALTKGDVCNYCSGTGVSTMPNGGGCNTAIYDETFNCGNWWTGRCSFGGSCISATKGGQCMIYEDVPSC